MDTSHYLALEPLFRYGALAWRKLRGTVLPNAHWLARELLVKYVLHSRLKGTVA
jgi:hypothetical protein